jgi:hypothetical protein
MTLAQIQKQVEVNVCGPLRVTKSFIPLLKAGQGKSKDLGLYSQYFIFFGTIKRAQ